MTDPQELYNRLSRREQNADVIRATNAASENEAAKARVKVIASKIVRELTRTDYPTLVSGGIRYCPFKRNGIQTPAWLFVSPSDNLGIVTGTSYITHTGELVGYENVLVRGHWALGSAVYEDQFWDLFDAYDPRNTNLKFQELEICMNYMLECLGYLPSR